LAPQEERTDARLLTLTPISTARLLTAEGLRFSRMAMRWMLISVAHSRSEASSSGVQSLLSSMIMPEETEKPGVWICGRNGTAPTNAAVSGMFQRHASWNTFGGTTLDGRNRSINEE
jgi:hypothetical protein